MTVVVGGDVCPDRDNESLLRAGDIQTLFGGVLDELQAADMTLVNLECPLLERVGPARKTGPVLGASVECAAGLKSAGIDLVGLANNHIMDHGAQGLRSTLAACREQRIDTVGADEDLDRARAFKIRTVKGVRFAVGAMAEREFSIAGRDRAGASPLDPMAFVRVVRAMRSQFDHLIVLLHSGNEGYPYPSPRLRDTCRFLVEEGALAVVCQHSHCPGTYESYHGSHIVYGQGNFLFIGEDRGRNEEWDRGFLVKLMLRDGRWDLSLVPFRQNEGGAGITALADDAAERFRAQIEERSRVIHDEERLQAEWKAYCTARRLDYLSHLLGLGRILRVLNRKLGLFDRLYSASSRRLMRNVIRCELHRDVLLTALEERDEGRPDGKTPGG